MIAVGTLTPTLPVPLILAAADHVTREAAVEARTLPTPSIRAAASKAPTNAPVARTPPVPLMVALTCVV